MPFDLADARQAHGSRPSLRGSGDLVADRRFLYAQAAAVEGYDTAAAEILEQTLDLAPHWAALWLALATAYESAGRREEAVAAFSRAAERDLAGELGCISRGLARRERPPPRLKAIFAAFSTAMRIVSRRI